MGHHCTCAGHPLSAGGYFLRCIHDFRKPWPRSEWRYPECGQPEYITPHSPVLHDFAEQKKSKCYTPHHMLQYFAHARRISSEPSSCSEHPGLAPETEKSHSDLRRRSGRPLLQDIVALRRDCEGSLSRKLLRRRMRVQPVIGDHDDVTERTL